MAYISHGSNVALAGVLSKLREVADIYKRIRSAGAAAFVSTFRLGREGHHIGEGLSSSSSTSSSSPSSPGAQLLDSVLSHWDDIEKAVASLGPTHDMSTLRSSVVAAYNECRNVQPCIPTDFPSFSSSLAPDHDPHSLLRSLLTGRQKACALMTAVYTSMPKGTSALPEATRCWARTAAAWEKVEGSASQALDCFRGALAAHEAAGGTSAISRVLLGAELEAHMQVVYDCTVGAARALWGFALGSKDGGKEGMVGGGGGGGGAASASSSSNSFSSSTTPISSPAAAFQLLQRYLVREAPLLLTHVPHERLALARLQAQAGRHLLDLGLLPRAETWLSAALQTADGGGSGANSESIDTQALVQQLLLSLAVCTVEQLSLAHGEGRMAEQGGGMLSTSAAAGGSSTTISLSAAVGKVTGYLAAAHAESTLAGRHLLVRLACLQGHEEEAGQHLQALLALPPSTTSASSSSSGGGEGGSTSLVPLADHGAASEVRVHPDYPLIASALRAYAVARNFDIVALKVFGQSATRRFPHPPETVLLRHELLVAMLASMRPSSSAGGDAMSTEGGGGGGGVSAHSALLDARVSFIIRRLVDEHTSGKCTMPAHVGTSLAATLQGGMHSAFEASAWAAAADIARLLLRLSSSGVCVSRTSSTESSSSAGVAQIRKVLALSLLHARDYSGALAEARAAMALTDGVVTRFLVFRVLAAMPVPAAAASASADSPLNSNSSESSGGADGLPLSQAAYASVLSTSLRRVMSAPDFLPSHLVGVVDELMGSGGGGETDTASSTATTSIRIAPQEPEKLAVAASALRKLLQSSAGYDPTAHHPGLRTAVLVRALVTIEEELAAKSRTTSASGSSAMMMVVAADDVVTTPSSAVLRARSRATLRLLYVCVERLSLCRRGVSAANPVGVPAGGATDAAFAAEVERTFGGSKDLDWCLQCAWNTCISARSADDHAGCLAAAAVVDSLAGTIAVLASVRSHSSNNNNTTTTIPPAVISAARVRNMQHILVIAHLLEAGCRLVLADEGTAAADAKKEGKGGVAAVAITSSTTAPHAFTHLCSEPVGRDPCVHLAQQSPAQHLEAALQHIARCKRAAADASAQEAVVAAAIAAGALTRAAADSLFASSSTSTSTTSSSASASSLSSGSDDRQLMACTANMASMYLRELGAAPGSGAEALPAILAAMEFHVRARMCGGSGDAAGGVGASGAPSGSSTLASLLRTFPSIPGMTPRILEHVSEVARQPPVADRALALSAVAMAVGLVLKPVSGGKGGGGSAGVDFATAAALLHRMLLLAPTRSDSLPMFEEIQRVLSMSMEDSTFAGMGVESNSGMTGSASSSSPTPPLYPLDEADFAVVLAWNHGCYFYRMHALERAEKFMEWAVSMLPLVSRLEALTYGKPMPQSVVAGVGGKEGEGSNNSDSLLTPRSPPLPTVHSSSACVCLTSAEDMRRQYEHLLGALRKQTGNGGGSGNGATAASSTSLFGLPSLGAPFANKGVTAPSQRLPPSLGPAAAALAGTAQPPLPAAPFMVAPAAVVVVAAPAPAPAPEVEVVVVAPANNNNNNNNSKRRLHGVSSASTSPPRQGRGRMSASAEAQLLASDTMPVVEEQDVAAVAASSTRTALAAPVLPRPDGNIRAESWSEVGVPPLPLDTSGTTGTEALALTDASTSTVLAPLTASIVVGGEGRSRGNTNAALLLDHSNNDISGEDDNAFECHLISESSSSDNLDDSDLAALLHAIGGDGGEGQGGVGRRLAHSSGDDARNKMALAEEDWEAVQVGKEDVEVEGDEEDDDDL